MPPQRFNCELLLLETRDRHASLRFMPITSIIDQSGFNHARDVPQTNPQTHPSFSPQCPSSRYVTFISPAVDSTLLYALECQQNREGQSSGLLNVLWLIGHSYYSIFTGERDTTLFFHCSTRIPCRRSPLPIRHHYCVCSRSDASNYFVSRLNT